MLYDTRLFKAAEAAAGHVAAGFKLPVDQGARATAGAKAAREASKAEFAARAAAARRAAADAKAKADAKLAAMAKPATPAKPAADAQAGYASVAGGPTQAEYARMPAAADERGAQAQGQAVAGLAAGAWAPGG